MSINGADINNGYSQGAMPPVGTVAPKDSPQPNSSVPPKPHAQQVAPVKKRKPNILTTTPLTIRDRFELMSTRPPLAQASKWRRLNQSLWDRKQHKTFKKAIQQTMPTISNEQQERWVETMHQVYDQLSAAGKRRFSALLDKGVLLDQKSEGGQPAVYQLYAMMTTKRLDGINGKRLAEDTLRILEQPFTITQKFSTMAPDAKKAVIKEFNTLNQYTNRSELPESYTGIVPSDLNTAFSATCVPSSQMYRMAENNPSELARQLNELSAMGYFWETAHRDEIWPKEPNLAEDALAEWNADYIQTGEDSFRVKVQIPYSGRLRAINAGMNNKPGIERSPAEALYQSALSNFGTGKRFNSLLGVRWDKFNNIMPGLNDMEKSFMESIIEDKGPIQSISYQVTSAKAKQTDRAEAPSGYLFGYTNSFESTTNHVLKSLKAGWAPIVGITYTNSEGKLEGGHEVTIVGAYNDKKTNELMFVIVDSDDGIPKPVVEPARKFVPNIHHMGFPKELATNIQKEMEPNVGLYFTPDANDAKNFDLVGYSKDQPHPEWVYWTWQLPMPEEGLVPDSDGGNKPGVNNPVPTEKTVLPDKTNRPEKTATVQPAKIETITPTPMPKTTAPVYQEFHIPPSTQDLYIPPRPGTYQPVYSPYPTDPYQPPWNGNEQNHYPVIVNNVPGAAVMPEATYYTMPEMPAQPIQWGVPTTQYVGATPIHQYPTYPPIGLMPPDSNVMPNLPTLSPLPPPPTYYAN